MKHANLSVFVPFAGCPHRCSFCNQPRITGQSSPPDMQAVRETLSQAAARLDVHKYRGEIAFFGGSFTALPEEDMRAYLEAAQPFLTHPAITGIRVSTRPDAVDDKVLSLLKSYGVTAVELGAQSMDDEVLRCNGRGHTAADTAAAAGRVRAHGLSLGLQMMTGLCGDTEQGAVSTAQALLALSPDTLRIYPTLVLRDTPLATLYAQGKYMPQSVEEAVALCARLLTLCEEQGVPVIRLGLHDSEELRTSLVAGPHHPAFRELCEAERFFVRMRGALKKGQPHTVIEVHPQDVSKAVGQKKSNLIRLRALGFPITIRSCGEVPRGQIRITPR